MRSGKSCLTKTLKCAGRPNEKYQDSLDGMDVPTEALYLPYRTTAKYDILERIVDISEDNDGLWLRLQWERLP